MNTESYIKQRKIELEKELENRKTINDKSNITGRTRALRIQIESRIKNAKKEITSARSRLEEIDEMKANVDDYSDANRREDKIKNAIRSLEIYIETQERDLFEKSKPVGVERINDIGFKLDELDRFGK